MRFKNFQRESATVLISGLIVSLLAITACGGGSSSSSGGSVTPEYTNPNLPRTDTQDWLIMYYCDADNNLEEFIMKDLNEMESVNLSAKKIKIIALVDRNPSYWDGDGDWSDTRAYEVKYDSGGFNTTLVSERVAISTLGISKNTSDAEVNMGSGDTLTKFIKFCTDNYPANHKMLLFTNHGGGWRDNPAAKKNRLKEIGVTKGVCWDESSSDAYLHTADLRTSIVAALGTGNKIDIIAFDACLMAMVEVAYELKDVANYMVASEETIPGYGFPYTAILNTLPSDLSTYTSVAFGTNIVDKYYNAYISGTNVENPGMTDTSVTLSLIDLSKITALTTAINTLGSGLMTDNGSSPNMNKRIVSQSFTESNYVDIKSYCTNETLRSTERTAVNTALTAAVIYNKAGSGKPGANGLSMFMPLKWTGAGEQAAYTSANILFAGAASSWTSYLKGITAPTATDLNEIEESANGGGIYVDIPTTGSVSETGYIYYAGDEDLYQVRSSDGTFRLTVSGTASGSVDIYYLNKSTGEIEGSVFVNTGNTINLSYNTATHVVMFYLHDGLGGFPVSATSYYTLTFTNN